MGQTTEAGKSAYGAATEKWADGLASQVIPAAAYDRFAGLGVKEKLVCIGAIALVGDDRAVVEKVSEALRTLADMEG